jgi:CheY-like chemotaxis protein
MSIRDFVTNPRNLRDLNRTIRRALGLRRSASRDRRRILLVEERPWPRRSLSRMLERAGFEVVPAGGGSQAATILGLQPVDLVVTDVALLHADGVELVRRLHLDHPSVPIVAIASTESAEPDLEAACAAGASRAVAAPFEKRRLVDAVRQILGS